MFHNVLKYTLFTKLCQAPGTTLARTGYFGASFEAVVTISSAKVSANGTYTAFINLANLSSTWWSNCSAACNIVVTDSNNNKLKSYVENFSKVSSTGIVWVKTALTTSSGGVVVVQTGSGVNNSNDPSTFTDCNIVMRYPLQGAEGNDTASGTIADAMTNIVYNASGVIGSGITTTQANSVITLPNTITALNNPATLTVTGWYKKLASAHINNVFFAWDDGSSVVLRMDDYTADNNIYIRTSYSAYSSIATATLFPIDNTWTHFSTVFDGSQAGNARSKVYSNGVDRSASLTYTGTPPSTLGNLQTTSTRQMDRVEGSEAEFRVYSSALSNNYITTDYNLQNHNQSSVYTVIEYTLASAGAAGAQGLAGASSGYANSVYQATIQVPSSIVFENGDYGVYIDLSKFNNTWWSYVTTLANIVFTDSANTKLKSFVEGFNASTKTGFAWVKATLSTVSGGIVKAQVSPTFSTTNLATTFTDLGMCLRLSMDEPSGVTDSTGNYSGISVIGPWIYSQSYSIPNGIINTASTNVVAMIDVGNVTQLNNTSNFTITMWEKTTPAPWTYGALWGKGAYDGYLMAVLTNSILEYRVNGPDIITNNLDVTDNTWHNLAFTFDGASLIKRTNLYNNGMLENSTTKGGIVPATTGTNVSSFEFKIGCYFDNGQYSLPGSYDEFRVYTTTKSSNWLKTDYILQNNNISAAYVIVDQSAPIPIGFTGLMGVTGIQYYTETDLGGVTGVVTINWATSINQKINLLAATKVGFTGPLNSANCTLRVTYGCTGQLGFTGSNISWQNAVVPSTSGDTGMTDIINMYAAGAKYFAQATLGFK